MLALMSEHRHRRLRRGEHAVELAVVGAGVVAAGAAVWALFGGKQTSGSSGQPIMPGCGEREVTGVVVGSAANAAAGAAAGPYGAAAGAATGVLLNPDTLRCGTQMINKVKKQICARADKTAAEIRKKGGYIPKEFSKLSCDQKIAFIAALGPYMLPVLLGTALASGVGKAGAQALRAASAKTCARADKVAADLARRGAKIPKAWDDMNCEQKVAFIVALGPFGMSSLVMATAVGTLATSASKEVKKYAKAAKNAVEDISKKLGIKAPKIDINVSVPKLFGLGDLGCEPFVVRERSFVVRRR